MAEQQQHSSHKTYRCHQGQNASAPVPSVFYGGAGAGLLLLQGIFSVPYEKTALFLTASDGQDPAAPSGLSDERSRLQSLREEFWPRWPNPGQPKQLETARF